MFILKSNFEIRKISKRKFEKSKKNYFHSKKMFQVKISTPKNTFALHHSLLKNSKLNFKSFLTQRLATRGRQVISNDIGLVRVGPRFSNVGPVRCLRIFVALIPHGPRFLFEPVLVFGPGPRLSALSKIVLVVVRVGP